VLGSSRYVVDLRTGRLSLQKLAVGASSRRFRTAHYLFSADLPFLPTDWMFEELLLEWQSEIDLMAADSQGQIKLQQRFRRSIRQACLRSCRWSVLRHRVRDALALDPETLDLARRSRTNVGAREISNVHYNHVVENLPALRQLRDDNPNLLWLVGLAEAEGVALKVGAGGLIEALRELVLAQFKLPPAAWRFLANGRRSDFRIVLDWLGARANPKGRWLELREWLRLRVALGSDEAIPAAVQGILMHDRYQVAPDGGSVVFRKATVSIRTVRIIIREAIARHRDGTLCAFTESELPDVLAWIGASGVALDENQQKASWHHLHHRAMAWKLDASLQSKRDELRWESLIGEHVVGQRRVTPVTDVWQLHRESQRQRNCMDNYLSDCMAGNVRMFSVQTLEGRLVGAIGLLRRGRQWHVLDARGFANTAPVAALTRLGEELAGRQTLLWQTLHPLLEQSAPAGVVYPTREEGLIVPGRDIAACVPYGDSETDADAGSDDETEYDEEYEPEEEHDRACPICGCYEWDCSHLVATVDYFNGGLAGGSLYDMKDELTDGLAERLLHMAKEGCTVTGCGEDFDRILRAIKKELPDWDDQQNLMDEYSGPILQAVLDQLGGLPGVEEHYWEFDGGMPGCSTCGRDFWAPDPESVIKELSTMLLISEDRPIRRSA
jgi:hypothetical protein